MEQMNILPFVTHNWHYYIHDIIQPYFTEVTDVLKGKGMVNMLCSQRDCILINHTQNYLCIPIAIDKLSYFNRCILPALKKIS